MFNALVNVNKRSRIIFLTDKRKKKTDSKYEMPLLPLFWLYFHAIWQSIFQLHTSSNITGVTSNIHAFKPAFCFTTPKSQFKLSFCFERMTDCLILRAETFAGRRFEGL